MRLEIFSGRFRNDSGQLRVRKRQASLSEFMLFMHKTFNVENERGRCLFGQQRDPLD